MYRAAHTQEDTGKKINALLQVAQEAVDSCDLVAAAEMGNQALHLAYEHLGSDHAETALPLAALARIYVNLCNFVRAEACALAAIQILTASRQSDTLFAARTRITLARALLMQDKVAGEALFESAIADLKKYVGDLHPETLLAINSQALAYVRMGRHVEAEKIIQNLLPSLCNKSMAPGEALVKVLSTLAIAVYGQGQCERAASYAETALDQAQQPGFPKTMLASIHGLLWQIHVAQKDVASSEHHARKMIETVERHGKSGVDEEVLASVREFVSALDRQQNITA